MKHFAFNEFDTKLINSANSEGQYKKHIRKIFPEFKTPTITNNSRRSSLMLNISFITISQLKQKRFAA